MKHYGYPPGWQKYTDADVEQVMNALLSNGKHFAVHFEDEKLTPENVAEKIRNTSWDINPRKIKYRLPWRLDDPPEWKKHKENIGYTPYMVNGVWRI